MQIGELFVGLGVKGSEKTLGAITSMRQGLKDTASTSLETKAAIVGVMYAMERLFSASGKVGTDLINFGALMDGGVKRLQQYQYIAKQVGSSNEEMTSTFMNLSRVATDTLTGHGAPERIALLSQNAGLQVGQMLQLLKKAESGNSEPLFQAINKALQTEKNVGYRNQIMKDFGISNAIGAGMIRNKFNAKDLAAAPTYSDKEIKSLDKANIAWSNLGNKIEMAVGHFNAKHGVQLVQDISRITDQVLRLVEAFTKLADKLKLFQLLGKSFEGWELILKGVNAAIEAKDSGKEYATGTIGGAKEGLTKPQEKATIPERIRDALLLGGQGESLSGIIMDMINTESIKDALTPRGPSASTGTPSPKAVAIPTMPATSGPRSTQNVEVNQTLNFQHEGKDAKRTGDSTKKGIQDAFRAIPAISGGY